MKFAILACTILLIATAVKSDEPVGSDRIEKGMLHVVSGEMPRRYRIGVNKRNEILRNPEYRRELAEAINEAAIRHKIDNPFRLVAIAFREGSFKRKVTSTSSIGERSTFQIAPPTERFIRKELDPDCTTKTYQGAAICAAALFKSHLDYCKGSVLGAYTKYATGTRCSPPLWSSKDRTAMSEYLLKYVSEE